MVQATPWYSRARVTLWEHTNIIVQSCIIHKGFYRPITFIRWCRLKCLFQIQVPPNPLNLSSGAPFPKEDQRRFTVATWSKEMELWQAMLVNPKVHKSIPSLIKMCVCSDPNKYKKIIIKNNLYKIILCEIHPHQTMQDRILWAHKITHHNSAHA